MEYLYDINYLNFLTIPRYVSSNLFYTQLVQIVKSKFLIFFNAKFSNRHLCLLYFKFYFLHCLRLNLYSIIHQLIFLGFLLIVFTNYYPKITPLIKDNIVIVGKYSFLDLIFINDPNYYYNLIYYYLNLNLIFSLLLCHFI